MEKTKKKFKIACYAVLVYVALSVIDLILSVVRMPDLNKIFPDVSEELRSLAWFFTIFSAVISILLHVWLGFWGLRKIEKQSTGIGHSVLEFILSVLAFFNLYESVKACFYVTDLFDTVVNMVIAVLWVAVLSFYDWNAIHFRRACLAEKK